MEDATIAKSITQVQNDSNIEITRNTKGFTYSVKAYGTTPEEIKTKTQALLATAKEIIKQEETQVSF